MLVAATALIKIKEKQHNEKEMLLQAMVLSEIIHIQLYVFPIELCIPLCLHGLRTYAHCTYIRELRVVGSLSQY